VWLKTSLREDITIVPEARIATCAAELRKFLDRRLESLEIGALVRHCVQALCAGARPSRRLDVTKVLPRFDSPTRCGCQSRTPALEKAHPCHARDRP
jgi:hypothetical protein